MSVLRRTYRRASIRASGNELLDRLLAASAFAEDVEAVSLEMEQELLKPGTSVRNVLFPTSSVCSILFGLKSGERAEIGTVGNEGFVGVAAVFRVPAAEYAIVQVPGEAYVAKATSFVRLLERNHDMRLHVMRYIGYAYRMAQQATLCNSYHSVEQRLARWLLMAHDRARTDTFAMTQELLSHMVAATRPRVTEAAGKLKSAGVIDYQRGNMRIQDRPGLERKACECYAAIKQPEVALRR